MKWVSPNGPADLAGLIPGDHVLQVDEADVRDETHIKVRHSKIVIRKEMYIDYAREVLW